MLQYYEVKILCCIHVRNILLNWLLRGDGGGEAVVYIPYNDRVNAVHRKNNLYLISFYKRGLTMK